MRVTIIRDDNLIIIDGRQIQVDLSDMPADLHAVQWEENHGHIERQGWMNQPIDSLADFQMWIERWNVAKQLADTPPVVSLAQAKEEKNAQINAARAAANLGTFPHGGKSFACDALSRSDIDGINGYVALNSVYPPGFLGAWKAIDNSYYPLPDIAAWKAFYGSMVATGSENFAHSQQLKATLASATTLEQVAAIVW